ncbi:MAG: RNA polymerase sigma factor [Gammaproteobacteria bacterium]|nr:RNA polymerase sigma factor [Gammaproteobacteria bacterium]MBT4494519.1 RNA polymerase sigma factor [Gammaproteobacteria bacterium]MBT7371729.1 RNA polymerase sigma factor [Gammaproteobacteria bacterium]
MQDRGGVQDKRKELDQFLGSVERPAYRMAEIATRNPDDALDIVQDTMFKLVDKYSGKPPEEWRPLFYSILHSRITDYHRRKTLTGRIFSWIGSGDEEGEFDFGSTIEGPLEKLTEQLTLEKLQGALETLSERQQQVFMLRNWQGFSVAETAGILKCSEGSIKTHMSRATASLLRAIDQGNEYD